MKFTQIKETGIYISDIIQTKEFYHDKLGLPVISLVKDRHVFFRAGNSVLLCFIADSTRNDTELPPHFASGRMHFAFECPKDEYEKWKQKIIELKIPIEKEAEWGQGLKSFYFRDPDEHLVEIVQEGIWGY